MTLPELYEVSIPNGKPGPLRPSADLASRRLVGWFQSQTGSQALSDLARTPNPQIPSCFNPKREARPSQTLRASALNQGEHGGFNPKREARPSQTFLCIRRDASWWRFQSQTGSQALSDLVMLIDTIQITHVSIPNGKPGPLRRG